MSNAQDGQRPSARSKRPRRQPTREDMPFVARRLTVLWVGFVALMAILGVRIYYLTILQGPELRESAEKNFLIEKPLLPPRGRILDRCGRPLAVNKIVYDIEMSPFKLDPDQIARTVGRLGDLLQRPDLLSHAETVVRLRPRWKTLRLVRGLDLDEALPVLEKAFELPGVIVTKRFVREYPEGIALGHITGHVGSIPQSKWEELRAQGYLNREKTGRQGAELAFESYLRGAPGTEMQTRDAHGRPRGSFVERRASPGDDIVLTIDLGLQRLADALLGDWKGAIIVLDPRNGEVLAMAEHPNYDPSAPWLSELDGVRLSAFNKSLQGGKFAPGSTFKVITAAAGLMQGRDPEERVYCDGQYHLPVKAKFPCHLRWGHESENMYEALQHSCNVYFYSWAHSVKARGMVEAAAAFGFGRPTGIDLMLPGQETSGVLARPGIDTIYLGSVLHMGIGQGSMIGVSPMQMARAYAALCNGGVLWRPRTLLEVRGPSGGVIERLESESEGELPLSDWDREQILDGLRRVTYLNPHSSEMRGTAARVGFKPEWKVAGKTGTAQTGRPVSNAWFCCFAPWDAPEIAITVLVEDAGHGGEVAAPLARQILAWYFGEPEPFITPPPHDKKPTPGAD